MAEDGADGDAGSVGDRASAGTAETPSTAGGRPTAWGLAGDMAGLGLEDDEVGVFVLNVVLGLNLVCLYEGGRQGEGRRVGGTRCVVPRSQVKVEMGLGPPASIVSGGWFVYRGWGSGLWKCTCVLKEPRQHSAAIQPA